MKKLLVIVCLLMLCGCGQKERTLEDIIHENNYIIVDVRTKLEYNREHVITSVNIPVEKIEIAELDKTKTILVYCQSGVRSSRAYKLLKAKGYDVFDLGAYDTITLKKGKEKVTMKINVEINGQVLTATLEDNSSAEELYSKLYEEAITIDMHDYAGMEKVGELGFNLPRNDQEMKVNYGDIILYLGNTLTIYYDENEWKLTKLGHIDDISQEELKELLGTGNVTVRLSISE